MTAPGNPGVGGPSLLLICETWPLLRLRLKVCITAEPWLGTTTKPFEEDLYLVLHAIKKPTATKARTATIQVNLVRILRFISCERTDAFPRPPQTGHERYLKAGIVIHLCIRNAREEQTDCRVIGTTGAVASCLEAVVSGQWPVESRQSYRPLLTAHWSLLTGHCLLSLRERLPEAASR